MRFPATVLLLMLSAPIAGAQADRVAHFIQRLDTGSVKIRFQAAFLLGRMRDPRAIPALVAALAHGEEIVRATAATSLRDLRGPLAGAALEQALGDSSAWVRAEALRGVGLLARHGAWKRAIALLSDPDTRVRFEAVRALGGLAEQGALLPLASIVERPSRPDLGKAAWRALRNLKGTIEVQEMAFLLRSGSSRHQRARAAILLAASGSADCTPHLVGALRDPDPHVRRFVVRALGRMSDRRALAALRQHVERETDSGVRDLVRRRLTILGKKAPAR